VAEGGEVLDQVDTGRNCYACILGSPERRVEPLLHREFEPVITALLTRL
jgi:hypothetical protein